MGYFRLFIKHRPDLYPHPMHTKKRILTKNPLNFYSLKVKKFHYESVKNESARKKIKPQVPLPPACLSLIGWLSLKAYIMPVRTVVSRGSKTSSEPLSQWKSVLEVHFYKKKNIFLRKIFLFRILLRLQAHQLFFVISLIVLAYKFYVFYFSFLKFFFICLFHNFVCTIIEIVFYQLCCCCCCCCCCYCC